VKLGKLAVETAIFPLYEVENGRYRLNVDPAKLKPVEEYLKPQGRFRHLLEAEVKEIQKHVDEEYAKLKAKVACFAA
jgi:pyruvate ferredoxin oxidoreductase beta subunit